MEGAKKGNGQQAEEDLIASEYLTFTLSSEEYAIDILKVQEIRGYEKPTLIANAPPFIKGVINLRGTIVPIVDLRLRFGCNSAEYNSFTVTIVLHIGNGSSMCAVDGGRSVETSMGMTPLEGLVMGTRTGDLDPAVLVHLSRRGGYTLDQLDDQLVKLKKEQFNLRFQRASGQLENTARIRTVRRDIARIKTAARMKRTGSAKVGSAKKGAEGRFGTMPKRVLQGVVVSDKNDKTIVVEVERRYTHPLFKKTVRRTKKYHAHDQANKFKVGDKVSIQESAPISKNKRWTVIETEA